MAAISNAIQDKTIDFQSIKPYKSEPITKFPQFISENCNHKIYNKYAPSYFPLLRLKAQKIKPSEILAFKITEMQKIQKAEEFDWIYGLDQIEKEYLSKDEMFSTTLNIEDIMKVNGYISRLTINPKLCEESNHKPGQFRHRCISWSKSNTDINESIASFLMQQEIISAYSTEYLASISDPPVPLKPFEKKASWLKNRFQYYLDHSNDLDLRAPYSKNHMQAQEINPNVVNNWANAKGKIDLIAWLRDRFHFFPVPSKIKSDLQDSIDSIKDPKMHPIEKAAKIWFDIIKIHISQEANKRTAKAIGSVILLQHGYLPPIIGPDNLLEYTEILTKSFEEKNGHLRFANYLAKEILNTQEKFKNDSRDISELS